MSSKRPKRACETASSHEQERSKAVLRAAVRATYRPGANTGTVGTVLSALAEEDVLTAPKQKQVQAQSYKDRERWFKQNGRTIDLPLNDGSIFKWSVVSPFEILQTMCQQVSSHRSLLQAALPLGEDLRVLLYTDELVPGNVLAPDPQRRTWAVYFTVAQYGVCSTTADCWYCCAMLRNSVKDKARSGLAGAIRALLESWEPEFLGRPFVFQPEDTRYVRLRIAGIIADEAALCSMLGVKGAAGRKPCWACSNLVFGHGMNLLGQAGQCSETFLL